MVGAHARKVFIITTTRLLKINFPAWQLVLRTFHQKHWPQYLGNHADYTDGNYTDFGSYTVGTK